jgi:hypothetical protein
MFIILERGEMLLKHFHSEECMLNWTRKETRVANQDGK